MSKRTKTPKELTRKQISRRERETTQRKHLLLGTAGVLVLVLLVAAWGLYDQYVLTPRQPVAVVSGVSIRQDTYQKLVRFRRWDYGSYLEQLQAQSDQYAAGGEDMSFMVQYIDQQIQQLSSQLSSVPTAVLDELIEDQIVRQEAARRGITVTAEEVQTEIEQEFGYYRNTPTPDPTLASEVETPVAPTAEPTTLPTEVVTPTIDPNVTPTEEPTLGPTATPEPTSTPMTYEGFVEQSSSWYETLKAGTGWTEEDLAWLVECALYRQRVADAIGAEAPTTQEQVHARHVLVDTSEAAEDVLARLEAGEDFAALATELSLDTSTKDQGGDLGWFGRGAMDSTFEEAAFALQPGETSGVVQSSYGYHVIRVDERDANRIMDADALATAQNEAFTTWLEEQTASSSVERYWDSSMVPAE
ncbi:MAG: peptidylprolyl isomerase [Anaerolineae bacterium]